MLRFTQSEIHQLSTWFAGHESGKVVNLLDLIPPDERAAIQDGTTTFDTTDYINSAIDLAHTYGHGTVYFNGKLWLTRGDHLIPDDVQFVGLGMDATEVRLIDGVPIDTCCFVTETYHAGMAQTTLVDEGTFGFSVQKMTVNGNKQRIPRVLVQANGAHSDSATTITVDSTAGCTAPGVLRSGSELIRYSGMTGTTFTGCERGHWRSYAAAIVDNAALEYFPEWGGVGLGLYGTHYLINDVRVENFRNMGVVSAYDRSSSGLFNYLNSRDDATPLEAALPDGDPHMTVRHIEILNNQIMDWCCLGPHDSHVSNFTIAKDGDDLKVDPDDPGSDDEDYLFPVAGLYIGSTSRPDAPIDYAAGSQFSDGHVWGNHSIGIVTATGGVIFDNVQSEGAHIQFNSRSGNAIGNLRLFGASGARSTWGAWLEYQADHLEIRGELLDYAAVVLGDPQTEEDYGGGYILVDSYTNNQSHTTLSAGIDAVVTTIPITAIVHTPGAANWLPYASNPDAGDSHLIAFGIPFDSQRGPLSVTIGDEEISYTSQDSTHLYGCTRGYNGTVAEAHSAGADVYGVLHVVRGETAPSFDPTRGTVIVQRQYNYEPVRTRQLESFLRRGVYLHGNERREAFGIGAVSAIADLDTKHKLFVSVTEADAENDYAVINAYGHMVLDNDWPTRTYHGMRAFLDTSFTTKVMNSARGVTGEVQFRGTGAGVQLTEAIGVYAGVLTQAGSTGTITRIVGVQTQLTLAGSGPITTAQGVRVGSMVGSGTVTTLAGVHITNQGRTGTTTSYGLRVLAQSGSTTNYAIMAEGGHSRFIAGGTTIVPVGIQRNSGQTANLLNFYDSDGTTVLSYVDKDGVWSGSGGGGGGTVTSVAMTVPSFLSVSGSPITTSGTLAVSLATQTANTVFAGPTTGGAAAPTFRALVAADIPTLTDYVAKTGDTMTGALTITPSAAGTAFTANPTLTTGTQYGARVTSTVTPAATGTFVGLYSLSQTTNTGVNIAGQVAGQFDAFYTDTTATSLTNLTGFSTSVNDSGGAVNISNTTGFIANAYHFGTGTVTNMFGANIAVRLRPSGGAADGNVTNVAGMHIQAGNSSTAVTTPGVVTASMGIWIRAPFASAAITTGYGLRIDSQVAASVGTAYAIQTAGGQVDFGTTTGQVLALTRIDTTVTAADVIGRIEWRTQDTSTTTTASAAEIEAQAVSTITTDINPGRLIFRTTPTAVAAVPTEALRITETQRIGVGGVTSPTAALHLPAGGTAANSAPLKFTSGSFLTTPEAGAMGFNGRFALTESDATRRYIVQSTDAAKVTAGAPYTNTGYKTMTINGVDYNVLVV